MGLAEAKRLLGSDARRAVAAARQAVAAAPRSAEAALVLGAALRRCNALPEARAVLAALAAALPGAWGVHYELGAVLAGLGQGDAAVASLARAASLNPGSSLASQALAGQLAMLGRDAEAAPAVSRDPGLAAAVAAFFDSGDPAGLTAAGLQLNDFIAVSLIAEVGLQLGRDAAVAELLAPLVTAVPGFLPARFACAMALHRLDRGEAALAMAGPLPATATFCALRGAIKMQLGDAGGAAEDYRAALALAPASAPAWLALGHALKAVGQQAGAVTAYQRAIELVPAFGEAWWSLANLKTRRFDTAEIDRMTALLDDPATGVEHRAHLQFALAKALEDRRDYAAAFARYAHGNALRRAASPHDADAASAFVARTIATFTPALLGGRTGCRDDAPVFIVGMPRSGSTLVEQILASHSAVEGASELPDITAIARRLSNATRYPEGLAGLDAADLEQLGIEYLERTRVRRRLGRPHFVDKFPGNFFHAGLIHLILPNARIIDVRRAALPCCFSLFKQSFAQGQSYSYDLTDLGRAYTDYVSLMSHFGEVLPGRILHLSYEALVEDPEAQIRRLLDHLGLDFEPGCLRFFETDRTVRTPSSEQVRQPIFRDGLDQWRNFEAWLGPLKAALGRGGAAS